MTLSPRQISDLLTTHGLRPSRALGQNFVTDANTVRRIVRLAEVGPGDRVLEIGPGLGSLTLALEEDRRRGHGGRGRSAPAAGSRGGARARPTSGSCTAMP